MSTTNHWNFNENKIYFKNYIFEIFLSINDDIG